MSQVFTAVLLGHVMFCDETYNLVYITLFIGQSATIIAGSVTTLDTGKEQMNIKMKENVSYEHPPSRIDTAECVAYGTLPNKP